jgi:hypothetical protein
MKIANIYFKPLSLLFVLALMVASCTEFQEFESTTYGAGPTITLSLVSVQDSTFTISVSSSADGSASVILLPGSGNAPPEDPEDLATGNINAMDYQSKHVIANTATNFTFNGLVQNATFEVMAVGTNLDGKYSAVSSLAVGTDDTHAPELVSTSPSIGYSPVLAVDGSVVLVFDEPVLYDDSKDLVFSEFFDGVDVAAGSVTVDFNEVTVTFGEDLTNRDYVMLSYPEGAFTDYSGNLGAAMESYFDGSGLVGLYWRAVAKEFEAISITPEEEVVPAGFDIVVTFAEPVDADDVADGDITLTYDDGMDILIRSVLASEVSAAGNELTITQSYSAAPGMEVTLNIPAELIGIGYGNPNAEVTASWIIALTLDDLVGDYSVDAVSYFSPGVYDEVWTATVELVPGNDTALSITLDAGGGGGVSFLAGFDVESLAVVIPAGTDAGDLYGYGATVIYGSDAATYLGGAVYGTITGAGSFALDELGMYLADYDNGDGTYGILWDAFNTTWTKSAKKAASTGSVPASKADRFK